MKFQKHDWVKVVSLKEEGEIVEVLSSGGYRVAVGGITLVRAEADLLLVPGGKQEKRKATSKAAALKKQKAQSLGSISHSVDLHGLIVEEAMHLVVKSIDRAILEEADTLKVLHGVGTGRIKDALHKYLATVPVVQHFKVDPDNPGVTWIYF